VVRCHDHAVGELEVGGDLTGRAVWGDQCDDPGTGLLAGQEVETETVDVDVATPIDHDLAPAMVGDSAQVGMPHHRAVALPAHELLASDKQASVGQPRGGPPEARGTLSDDLTIAVEIDRDNLLGSPVREPQTVLVPTRRLADRKTTQQDVWFRH